jgi:hypothetical protein
MVPPQRGAGTRWCRRSAAAAPALAALFEHSESE